MKKKIICSFFGVLLLTSCGSGPESHYYLIAKRTEQGPQVAATLTVLRQFEKQSWCESEAKGFSSEEGFTAECVYDALEYKPMFEGGAVGYWYAVRKVGKFPPSVIFYEFNPPLPEAILVQQLQQMAPHTLKFAALHQAPAEVQIISPTGELLQNSR